MCVLPTLCFVNFDADAHSVRSSPLLLFSVPNMASPVSVTTTLVVGASGATGQQLCSQVRFLFFVSGVCVLLFERVRLPLNYMAFASAHFTYLHFKTEFEHDKSGNNSS
jgi:hypothetical protein